MEVENMKEFLHCFNFSLTYLRNVYYVCTCEQNNNIIILLSNHNGMSTCPHKPQGECEMRIYISYM